MMKPILASLAVLATSPALAHTGSHMHPHANDPSWLPILITGLVIAGAAATVAVVRRK